MTTLVYRLLLLLLFHYDTIFLLRCYFYLLISFYINFFDLFLSIL